jgi:hypothetical protein
MSNSNYEINFEQQIEDFAASSEKDEDAIEKQTTSSIFSNAAYCIKKQSSIKEFKI